MKRCPYCEAELSNNIKTCKYCGESVIEKNRLDNGPYENKENKNKTKLSERVLFLVPNIIILWSYLFLFWIIIGVVDQMVDPHYTAFKTLAYNHGYTILLVLSIFIGILMLYVPTKKKMYTLYPGFVCLCVICLIIAYAIVKQDFKMYLERQEYIQRELDCKNRGYSSCSEELGYFLEILNRYK